MTGARLLAVLSSIIFPFWSFAQCAMCRTQVKNNVSNGDTTLAEGLNNGIMFLFFTPYIVVFLMIFLWYKYSKEDGRKITLIERLKGQMPKMS